MNMSNTEELVLRAIIQEELKNVHVNCKQDIAITELSIMQTKIIKELFGNGHEGMVKTLPRLEETVSNLCKNIEANTKVIADLVTAQVKTDTAYNVRNDMTDLKASRDHNKTVTFLMAIGILVSIIIGSVNLHRNNMVKDKLESNPVTIVTEK